MRNITKLFPGVRALDDVNLQVKKGTIHALVGENGAGKSTLMNVLSGIYPYGSYTGDIVYEGEVCKFAKITDSEQKGIVIIHQELALVPYMTIGENMFLGNEQGKSFSIDWDGTYEKADKYLKIVGLAESSRTLIKDIGVGKQQLVEIAKALAKNARLLILDEPTSSLNESDSKALLDLLLRFKQEGMTCIIISHKLNEVSYVADDITVIRDGKTIETLHKGVDDFSEDRIIRGMVGREISDRFPKRSGVTIGDVCMEVRDWTVFHPVYRDKKVVDNVSMYVRKGEVVGITTAKYSGTTSSGATIEGIGFAIPIDDVIDMIQDLKDYGYVTGAYLGITVRTMDKDTASAYNLPTGSYVDTVTDGSCAQKAGLQPKDIIVGLGDYTVTSNTDLTRALRKYKAGETVELRVYRSGKELTLNVTLDEKPNTTTTDDSTTPTGQGELPSNGDYEEWFKYFFGNQGGNGGNNG